MPVNIRQLIAKSPTKQVRAWLRVLGPPFIALTVVLTLLGTAIAFRDGYFNLPLTVLVLISSACIHFGASCINDYFDFKSGTDNVNTTVTAYSGGSRVIQENLIKPRTMLFAAFVLLSGGACIGLVLTYLCGLPILVIGGIGMFLAIGYVEPHINLSAKGLGELSVFVAFGPLMVSGAYFVQAKHFDSTALFVGVILGIIAGLVLWINEIPDFEADEQVGKKNLVVRIGKKRAAFIYVCFLPVPFILTAVGVFLNMLPLLSLIVFLTLPIAFKAARITRKYYEDVYKLLPANALTIALIISFGSLMAFSFIVL